MDEMTDAEFLRWVSTEARVANRERIDSIADGLESPWVPVDEFMENPVMGISWIRFAFGSIFDARIDKETISELKTAKVTHVMPILKPIPPIEEPK